MRREPDNLETIDDSGTYDVRKLREEGRLVYVERSKDKGQSWLVALATVILAGGIGAAWTANARLSSLETQVTDLKDTVARLERLLEYRYRGGADDPHAR